MSNRTEWSFHYHGPKLPSKARGCMLCASAHSGMCMNQPPHAGFVDGCGLCLASKEGFCGSHGRGVEKALDDHAAGLDDEQLTTFKAVRVMVESELSNIPDSAWVRVDVSCHSGQNVDLAGERTGMPARFLSVTVSQVEG